jgi:hypothetical protein
MFEFVEPGQREVHKRMENKNERLTPDAREPPQSPFASCERRHRTRWLHGLLVDMLAREAECAKPHREELCVSDN